MSCLTGDQIGHLWWRILNGELPKKPPKVFTILIGTNDLTAADCNMNQTELLLTVPGITHRSGLIFSFFQPPPWPSLATVQDLITALL